MGILQIDTSGALPLLPWSNLSLYFGDPELLLTSTSHSCIIGHQAIMSCRAFNGLSWHDFALFPMVFFRLHHKQQTVQTVVSFCHHHLGVHLSSEQKPCLVVMYLVFLFSSHKRWESVQLESLALRRNFKHVLHIGGWQNYPLIIWGLFL